MNSTFGRRAASAAWAAAATPASSAARQDTKEWFMDFFLPLN